MEQHETLCVTFSFLIQFIPSSERNCYLFSTGLEDLEDLDLNKDLVIYETGNKNVWETYEFVQIESEICLEEQACQNNGVCLMDSCEPEGYRCACDSLHSGKRCELGINDFDIQFPASEQNEKSFIFVKDAIKSDLNQFTFTTWLKIDVGLSRYHLLTYIVQNVVHIQLYLQGESTSTVGAFFAIITNSKKGCIVQPLNDNIWHHFAYLRNSEGDWNIFVDGKLFAIRTDLPAVIPKGGMVYIGNVRNLGVIDEGIQFVGELSRLHVWDHVLSGEEVERMSRSPTNDVGNVLSWFKLQAGRTIGNVEMIKPSTVINTAETKLYFQLYFYATNRDKGYISWPASFKQLDALSVCFWLKTYMKTVYISHGSKDEDRNFAFGVNSDDFMFAFINSSKINRYKNLNCHSMISIS